MLRPLNQAARLSRKLGSQFRLLLRDPESAGRNLLQFTNPKLFESRLVDVVHPVPMHVRAAAGQPALRLNVLDTGWAKSSMTGGPNTVINLALRVAQKGVAVRFVATVAAPAIEPEWFRKHGAALLGGATPPDVLIAHAGDPGAPLPVGPGDVFLATHWSTAQQLMPVLPSMGVRQFFYMLQEFEAGFYGWSSNYARVVETYGMDFWPIVNEKLLADFLFAQPLGRLSAGQARERALVFEPAVDRSLFHPPAGVAAPADAAARPRRVLFYARPTNARNMFGLGLMALREAAPDPAFAGWEFLSIGSRGSVPDVPLGGGHVLRSAPWVDYLGYADLLREADLLLCPMLSPHTSYPVLEMAACGGLCITNTFATKDAQALAALSPRIVAVDPTVAGFAAGLTGGARRVNAGEARDASLSSPADWAVALQPAVDRMVEIMHGFVVG